MFDILLKNCFVETFNVDLICAASENKQIENWMKIGYYWKITMNRKKQIAYTVFPSLPAYIYAEASDRAQDIYSVRIGKICVLRCGL